MLPPSQSGASSSVSVPKLSSSQPGAVEFHQFSGSWSCVSLTAWGCIMLRTSQPGADELPPSQPGAVFAPSQLRVTVKLPPYQPGTNDHPQSFGFWSRVRCRSRHALRIAFAPSPTFLTFPHDSVFALSSCNLINIPSCPPSENSLAEAMRGCVLGLAR